MATALQNASIDRIPALMTRRELAAWCNALWPDRPDPITPRGVQYWELEGLLTRHPAYKNPARYSSKDVRNFIDNNFLRET